jgi:hypothetical protein
MFIIGVVAAELDWQFGHRDCRRRSEIENAFVLILQAQL